MADYNHVTLVGNISSDVKFIAKDKNNKEARAEVKIGCSRSSREADIIDHFNLVGIGSTAQVFKSCFKIGKKVLIDGHIQVRSSESDEGLIWTTEIIVDYIKFLEEKVEV